MTYYRCSECRRPIGVMLENDGYTARMFVCPHSHRGATAVKDEDWNVAQAAAAAPARLHYKAVFDRPTNGFDKE